MSEVPGLLLPGSDRETLPLLRPYLVAAEVVQALPVGGTVAPMRAADVKRFRLPAGPLSGMRMVVRTLPADVGMPWLCETGQEIDAGVPALHGYPNG